MNQKVEKVFVAGGTGLVGRAITSVLNQSNYQIFSAFKNKDKLSSFNSTKIIPIIADLQFESDWIKFAEQCQLIIDATSFPIKGKLDKKTLLEAAKVSNNIIDNLFTIVKKNGATLVICDGIGQDQKNPYLTVDESNQIDFEPYAFGHALNIRLPLRNRIRESGINFFQLYFGLVYGIGGFLSNLVIPMMRKGIFKIPGEGNNFFSFTYNIDIGIAIQHLINSNLNSGNFCVVDNQSIPMRELFYHLAEVLKVKQPGNMPKLISKMLIGSVLTEFLTSTLRVSNNKLKNLGWKPTFTTTLEGITKVAKQIIS